MFRRILALVAVVGLAAAFAILVKFPAIKVGETWAPQNVSVEPKQPTLVCAGPVFVNGGQNGVTLGSFTQSGIAALIGKDGNKNIALNVTSEQVLSGQTTGTIDFNAVQAQFANGKQAFGLAASNCVPGSNEEWLIAGDNSVGREALLILANPTGVDATVSLQLYGTSGPIQGAGLSGISAPAGKVTVLPLSSFAPKAETFAVNVSSRGAELGIWLQQKTVRGLTPGGLDLVGVSAMPSKEVEIPGVFIRTSAALATLASGNKDFQDVKPILRVTAPGDNDAEFTAQVLGADGSSFGTVIQGTVPAGSTRDFALQDVADGNYSIHIESNEPLLASCRFSRMSGANPDFAWAQAVAPMKLNAGFSTVPGAISALSIMNANDSSATVTISGRAYKVAANSNLVVTLTAGVRYTIKSSQEVAVSQVVDIRGGVSVVPVVDYRTVGGQLKVSVR
jgi:hypothetical protein